MEVEITVEDNKDVNVNENTELNEEDLTEIAGGSNSNSHACRFTPTGKEKFENGYTWLECNSFCGICAGLCGCHGQGQCINKWHRINEDKLLDPINATNHYKKRPPNYNTANKY